MDSYIAFDKTTGFNTETSFTYQSSGVSDGGKGAGLDPATGKFHQSLMPDGLGAEVQTAEAGEALSTSTPIVELYYDDTTLKVRKSDATSTGIKKASGFIKENYSSGASVTVYLEGNITGLSGLDVTKRCFVSKTAGAVTQDVSGFTTGDMKQDIGFPISSTEMRFQTDPPLILA